MKRLAMFVCALAVAVPALAQDASGKWEVTVNSPNGQNNATMALTKDGEKLTGTIAGRQGQEIPLAGTQKAADVVLAFSVQTQNGLINITLKGRQDGDSLKGSAQFGDTGQGDWTAVRATAAKTDAAAPSAQAAADISGTWALEVNVEGNTRTPTAILKQDGEKLTGTYKSQLGDVPLSGQIKGKEFTFQLTLTFDGNSLTIVYAGTAEAATMSGKVSIADMGSGTFTGKKQ